MKLMICLHGGSKFVFYQDHKIQDIICNSSRVDQFNTGNIEMNLRNIYKLKLNFN
jgi:hypothetical protein